MIHRPQYIFRSGELFIQDDTTVPMEIPEEFAGSVADSIDLTLAGIPSRAILLSDEAPQSPAPVPTPTAAKGHWLRLREIFGSTDPALRRLASPSARALGLINWHHTSRFCGKCGAPLVDHGKEIARLCSQCGSVSYPRISPAIIVVVEKEGQILLARHSYRNQDMYACVAGFLEHGETLEECVAREVREEIGIEIQKIRYAGSQSWPYPDQFMIAFRAEWKSGDIRVDPTEILEAKWFDRDNLPNHPMPGTVAWNLIHGVFNPET